MAAELSPAIRDMLDKQERFLQKMKEDVDFLKRNGADRDLIEQHKSVLEQFQKATREELEAHAKRLSEMEVAQKRANRFGGSGRTAPQGIEKAIFAHEAFKAVYSKQSNKRTLGADAFGMKSLDLHAWCIRNLQIAQSPRARAIEKAITVYASDPEGLIPLFQDPLLALADRYYMPTLREIIPVINIATRDFRFGRRSSVNHLVACVATQADAAQANIILDNAQGVKVGSTYTLSKGLAQEEDIIVQSVDLATNTVTATVNLGNTHPVNREFIGDDYTFTAKTKVAVKGRIVTVRVDDRVRNLRTTYEMAREDMEDAPRFEQELRMFLPANMGRQFEKNVFYGNGTNEEWTGIFNDTDTQSYSWSAGVSGDRREDAIGRAILLLRKSNRRPEYIHLTPDDVWTMRLTRDDNQRYLDKIMVEDGQAVLWSLPVRDEDALKIDASAGNDALVANWSQGTRLYNRTGASEIIISSENKDNVETDMVTIAARERMGFVIPEPKALVRVKFDSQPA